MRGKLIVIEGTDCSGKATQVTLLKDALKKLGFPVFQYAFPSYDTPTGRIIGGPFLGKESICSSWFPEGPTQVDAKVSTLLYAADRKYNIFKIEEQLNRGVNVILDRYTYSNMAHQCGKEDDLDTRLELYDWISKLEFDFLGLPIPDIRIFLHMPFHVGEKLRNQRSLMEKLDEAEKDDEHLKKAERAYLELAARFHFHSIECAFGDDVKSIEEIHSLVFHYVLSCLE